MGNLFCVPGEKNFCRRGRAENGQVAPEIVVHCIMQGAVRQPGKKV